MNNYELLTFETIVAEPVQPKQKAISSHIQMKENGSGTTVNKYEITRNEFFHGVIPVNIGN